MNIFMGVTKSLRWFMALLVVAFVAGCGGSSGVAVAPGSTKAITAYSLAAYPAAVVTINEPLKTIAVIVPNGTSVTALVATFTSTGVGSPTVGGVSQVSGTTVNDFTLPKPYIVTAGDGTTATYTVTVSVASASSKAMSSFSFAAYPAAIGTITGTASPFDIAVTVPSGTVVTNLVATFAATGTGVKVASVSQVSGTTANDFTTPKAYIVTAADSTTATYRVTVTVASTSAKAITGYSFAAFPASIGVISGTTSPFAIAVTVPNGTSLTGLVATFTTTGASVTVGAVTQVSGTTLNNFPAAPASLAYTVHAADATTAIYNVTVTVAAASTSLVCTGTGTSCVPLGGADNFSILAQTMITDAGASSITGNIGVSPAAGSTMTVACASMLTGKVYQVDDTFADAACSLSGTASGGANKTIVDTAVANALTAYNDAAGRTVPAPTVELGAGNISGMTLTPGIYKWSTSVLIYANNPNNIGGGDTTGVTLDCTAGGSTSVFIFQIAAAQTLTLGQSGTAPTGGPANINLKGGCLASNIFWQVGGDVTILPNSVFNGNILTATQVVMQSGAVVHGRALAQTAVTLISNAVGP
ncbi:putative glycoside hydrolase [mine drainage metagenome]|uniref:Putative glycoside hydrolase n=1 Tax=mine drainage metagenome TaxID=410659 RepID=A0A1J5SBM4_9ZZZZ